MFYSLLSFFFFFFLCLCVYTPFVGLLFKYPSIHLDYFQGPFVVRCLTGIFVLRISNFTSNSRWKSTHSPLRPYTRKILLKIPCLDLLSRHRIPSVPSNSPSNQTSNFLQQNSAALLAASKQSGCALCVKKYEIELARGRIRNERGCVKQNRPPVVSQMYTCIPTSKCIRDF